MIERDYRNVLEFVCDAGRIFDDCRAYTAGPSPASRYYGYREACVIEDDFMRKLERLLTHKGRLATLPTEASAITGSSPASSIQGREGVGPPSSNSNSR